ncbi:Protein of unknown function [Gryllus bimaculatus]|nr:Protein of unknown function [Gryllus bimaculatus]
MCAAPNHLAATVTLRRCRRRHPFPCPPLRLCVVRPSSPLRDGAPLRRNAAGEGRGEGFLYGFAERAGMIAIGGCDDGRENFVGKYITRRWSTG